MNELNIFLVYKPFVPLLCIAFPYSEPSSCCRKQQCGDSFMQGGKNLGQNYSFKAKARIHKLCCIGDFGFGPEVGNIGKKVKCLSSGCFHSRCLCASKSIAGFSSFFTVSQTLVDTCLTPVFQVMSQVTKNRISFHFGNYSWVQNYIYGKSRNNNPVESLPDFLIILDCEEQSLFPGHL